MFFRSFIYFALFLTGVILLFVYFLTQPFVSTPVPQSLDVNPQSLERHVNYLSKDLYPRNFRKLENLHAAADYIEQNFLQYTHQVSRQTYTVTHFSTANIIAQFGPKEGKLIVIGAHYDSAGITPGADDNASGVAGLLELARLFSLHPPTQPVQLVAYTLEEPPYFRTEKMGSFIHARSIVDSKQSVQVMISLEMIGYFSDEEQSQTFPISTMKLFYPSKGNFIALVSRFSDWQQTRKLKYAFNSQPHLPSYSINTLPVITGVDFSDHLNYWKFNIPALMVTDTSFYRNFNYHQQEDTAEKLNYLHMAEVVQAVYSFCFL